MSLLPFHLRRLHPSERWRHCYAIDENGCWSWTGTRDTGGYGRIEYRGKTYAAHRVAYEADVGPIPDGLVLDHLCRNRACVNPEHLEAVTMRENNLRGMSPPAKYAARQECGRGHPLVPENLISRNGKTKHRLCKKCRMDRYAERTRIAVEAGAPRKFALPSVIASRRAAIVSVLAGRVATTVEVSVRSGIDLEIVQEDLRVMKQAGAVVRLGRICGYNGKYVQIWTARAGGTP